MALDRGALTQMLRGGLVSMVFQEPMLALDPVYTIGQQIAETVVAHENTSYARGASARSRCWSMCAFLRRNGGLMPIRTSYPAACGKEQ